MSEHTTEELMTLVRRYGDYCAFSEDAADSGAMARFNAIRSYATALCQQGEPAEARRENGMTKDEALAADEETVRAAIEAAQLPPNRDMDAYEALARLVTRASASGAVGETKS